MKKRSIIVFVVVVVLAFLATAFVQWQIDPGKWTGAARFACIFSGLAFGLALFGMSEDMS